MKRRPRSGHPTTMKRICIFCGSSSKIPAVFDEAAATMAREIAVRGIGVVYGGASVGTMNVVAEAALDAGGDVVGVIPEGMKDREIAHTGLTELHVVDSMHSRKALMVSLSNAFIALPGGLGTLDELFETWTWRQLGIHNKPIGMLNVEGYYDGLLSYLDSAADVGYVRRPHRDMLIVDRNASRLLQRLIDAAE